MEEKLTKDRVTIYEVAKRAGVSLATVSRVINKTGNVSKETEEKVNAVIAKLGYQPSSLAQGLANSKSKNIAVVIPSTNYVFISNFLNGVVEVCKQNGNNVVLFTTSHSTLDALSTIDKVIKSHVDGAIIFDDELNSEDVKFINSFSVPCVVINHNVVGPQAACITFNHEIVLGKIIENNFKNNGQAMTFVHSHNGGRLLNRVEKKFKELHEEYHKSYQVFNCDDSYAKTYNDFKNYFESNKSGYFVVYRDSLGGAILNAALDSGLRVPEDVEIISIIGTKYGLLFRPQMSNLELDFSDVGKRAVYLLNDLVNETLTEKTVRYDVAYNKRGTTK